MAKTPIKDFMAAAPSEVPAIYEETLKPMAEGARLIMNSFRLPYSIQAKLAEDEFTSVNDIALRWVDLDQARSQAPGELGFSAGDAADRGPNSFPGKDRHGQTPTSPAHLQTSIQLGEGETIPDKDQPRETRTVHRTESRLGGLLHQEDGHETPPTGRTRQ